MTESISTRRTFLRRGGAVTAALTLPTLLAACGGGSGSGSSKRLTVVSYGGAYQKAQDTAYWKPYAASGAGVKIRQDSPSDNAKIKAMVESGNVTWDVAITDDSFGHSTDGKYLEPIDYSVIDRSQFLEGYADTYRLGADVEATVLAVRADKFGGRTPSGLADFFDTTRFPGKRSAWSYTAGGILEAALIADGVRPADLYPIDVDRALRKLDTIRDELVWWSEGAQAQQLLSSGETPISILWSGRAIDAGKDVSISWDQWLTQNAWWVVPKGTKNKALAMELLKFSTAPEQQVALSRLLPYGPTNKTAVAKADKRFAKDLPTNHLDGRVVVDSAWWSKNYTAVDKQFQSWMVG